jgi:hypothetical protein
VSALKSKAADFAVAKMGACFSRKPPIDYENEDGMTGIERCG